MKGSIKTLNEAKIFIQGCTFLGVGGGGNPEEGLKVLTKALEKKGEISWIDVDDISDDAIAICTFLMGSTAPLTKEKEQQMIELGLTDKKYPANMLNAIDEWEKYTGKKVDVVVALEVGGSNLPLPMSVARLLDKTIVDGDYAGRAIPEIFQISLMKENINFCPAVSFDKYGNVCIMKDAISLTIAERIGKYLSEVAFGSTALAGFPITGKQLKQLLVRGSITKANKIGTLLEQAKKQPENLSKLLAQENMKKIFKGKVCKKDWKDEGGYYIGIHTLEGIDEYDGKQLKMYFKNETHIAWIDEEYVVSSPDLICTIEPNEIKPLRNDDIVLEQEIEVYILPCDPVLKDKKIIKYLEPKYFGFNIDYKPI
ncbi:MAG: DUF917 domain-containing protein [Anaerovorax sp.]|nr:DUF917 domain-containing protein [Anaerovorax sp.]